jgi:2-C-methyl-D-erythritol 4-phosphate cytidylyltransferase
MKKVALIVAGGRGERMNSEIPKQFLLLNNLPILMHTIKQFSHFEETIVVLPKTQFDYWNKLCKDYGFNKKHTLIKGGGNRFQSAKNGLAKINDEVIVAIHDGVRPLISKALINRLVAETKKGIGIIPIVPIKDSIRKVEGRGSKHISRSNIYQVQTPQCFISTDIKAAYKQKFSKHFTDDASVLESAGCKITTILGEKKNLKITTEEDLKIANAFMQ